MPGYAIGKSMNYGFPGTFARTPDDVIMSRPVASDSADIAFGAPAILDAGNTYTAAGAALKASNFCRGCRENCPAGNGIHCTG